MASIVALTIATLIPLVFLYVIYTRDIYHTGEFQFILYCLGWGGVAYLLAYLVNSTLVNSNVIGEDFLVRFFAPFIEETFKGLFLLYLIRRPNFSYFIDGAVYGFASGIGFAIFENFEYVLGNPSIAVSLAISRVLSTNLIHAVGSALIGISLGLWRVEGSRLRRFWLFVGGWILAITLHSTFNNIVSDDTELIFAFILSFIGIGIIVFAIRQGLQGEKIGINKNLGMTDGVTSNEVAAVQNINKLDDILKKLAQLFGPQKASQIEKFLYLQARLGILKTTAEKLHDPKLQAATEAEIKDLRIKMNTLRVEVGAYCMLYLRNVFPEEVSPIYELLQNRLKSTDKNLAGTGLWSTLTQRVKPNNG